MESTASAPHTNSQDVAGSLEKSLNDNCLTIGDNPIKSIASGSTEDCVESMETEASPQSSDTNANNAISSLGSHVLSTENSSDLVIEVGTGTNTVEPSLSQASYVEHLQSSSQNIASSSVPPLVVNPSEPCVFPASDMTSPSDVKTMEISTPGSPSGLSTSSQGESLRSSMFLPVTHNDYLTPEKSPEDIPFNICNLPECSLLHIFHYMDIKSLVLSVRKTCRYWHNLTYDRLLWKVLKLDRGGLGEKMGDTKFLKLLAPIADLVEELVFGFTMLLTDESFMHKNIHCSKLSLIDFCLTNVTTNAIIYLTEKYPKITALNLNHCSYINIYKCLDYIVKFQDLKFLSFEDFVCTADNRKLNDKILKVYQGCQHIKGSDIYATELSDDTLAGIFSCSRNLTDLDITGADDITIEGFRTLNKNIHSLQGLNIGYTMIGDKALKVIAENSPKLKYLNITSCMCITDVGIGYIAAHCPKLECLLVNKTDPDEMGCIITSNGLQHLALGCPKLRQLFVSYCQLMDDNCIIAVAENCPKLSELRVAGCLSITDLSLRALGKHSRYLRDLQVSECAQITSHGIGFLIAKCKWLQSLSVEICHRVSNINITKYKHLDDVETVEDEDEDDEESSSPKSPQSPPEDPLVDTFVKGLEKCTKPMDLAEHSLQLQDNLVVMDVGTGMDKVLLSLQDHSHLKTLHLSFCSKITNETIIDIARNCPDLEELSLRGCHLLTDISIATLVRTCPFLRILDISGGSSFFSMKISSVSLSAIAHDCKHIERLMISKNKLINLAGLEVLFQKCKSLQSLEVTVGEPMYASFTGVMSLINNIKDRIVKIANQVQVVANKQSGNLHIQFYPLGTTLPPAVMVCGPGSISAEDIAGIRHEIPNEEA